MEIHTKYMLDTKARLNRILAENTGKTLEQIMKDADRDYWMTSAEAKEYGMVDEVLTRKK